MLFDDWDSAPADSSGKLALRLQQIFNQADLFYSN